MSKADKNKKDIEVTSAGRAALEAAVLAPLDLRTDARVNEEFGWWGDRRQLENIAPFLQKILWQRVQGVLETPPFPAPQQFSPVSDVESPPRDAEVEYTPS